MYGWRFYPEPKAWTCFFEYPEQTFGFFFILFFVKMFTPNFLMKWGFRGVQSGLVNKGVVFFFLLDDLDYARFHIMALWRWEKRKTHSGSILIFEDACASVYVWLLYGFDENGKHLQKTMQITLAVAFLFFFGWVRLGADILHNNPYNFQGDCVGCWEWIIRFIM